jgi:hypothetical protein
MVTSYSQASFWNRANNERRLMPSIPFVGKTIYPSDTIERPSTFPNEIQAAARSTDTRPA